MRAIALAILTYATAWFTVKVGNYDKDPTAQSIATVTCFLTILLFVATIVCIIAGA
jgi:hypothetical protein